MEKFKTKFRPILFSTPMVQAILENRKTMTRRTKGLEAINENPNQYRYDGISMDDDCYNGCPYFEYLDNHGKPLEKYHPIDPVMNVGDILWVRETFTEIPEGKFIYKANPQHQSMKWKPSLFMPKQACRIFLKVKAINVERLQDINLYHIINEGVQLDVFKIKKLLQKYGENNPAFNFLTQGSAVTDYDVHKLAWADLWISINGIQSWTDNPFVWVYEFERIEKPLDFN